MSKASSKTFVANVSRRVTACNECRSHKIRCQLQDDGRPCVRCERMDLPCKVTKSLQSILDGQSVDEEWRTSVEKRLQILFEAVGMPSLANRDAPPGDRSNGKRRRIDSLDANAALGLLADAASEDANSTPTLGASTSWNDASNDPASAPGLHLTQITSNTTPHERSHARPRSGTPPAKQRMCIIVRSIITEQQAITLLGVYLRYLDPQAYSIVTLAHTETPTQRQWNVPSNVEAALQSIRSCPLLLLSLCTVAALHCSHTINQDGTTQQDPHRKASASLSRLYTLLHAEFVRASAQQSVIRDQSLDDIRALLIASWWLRDLSWISSGSAVRIATERGMQEAYKRCSDMVAGKQACRAKAFNNQGPSVCKPGEAAGRLDTSTKAAQQKAYEAARLYYLVYVADHQAAIPFSRPPMTRQHAAVRNVRAWLAGCAMAHEEEDVRLAAQVELWVIAHDVVDDFGVDVQQALTQRQVTEQMPRFLTLVDRWRERWQTFPAVELRQEIALHADMMKLFVAAHTFRSPRGVDPLSIAIDDDRYAEWALDDVEQRESFAEKSLPDLPPFTTTSRFDIGCQAVETANLLIKRTTSSKKHRLSHLQARQGLQPGTMFSLPIYPFAMVLFACLFLNKLSRRKQQSVALPDCSPSETLRRIEQVATYLDTMIVPFCAADHISTTVLPGLLSLLQAERQRLTSEREETEEGTEDRHGADIYDQGHSASRSRSVATEPNQQSFDEMFTLPQSRQQDTQQDAQQADLFSGITLPSPAFDFDLKSLDQLSGERYLSGVTNDAALWNFDMFSTGAHQAITSNDNIVTLM